MSQLAGSRGITEPAGGSKMTVFSEMWKALKLGRTCGVKATITTVVVVVLGLGTTGALLLALATEAKAEAGDTTLTAGEVPAPLRARATVSDPDGIRDVAITGDNIAGRGVLAMYDCPVHPASVTLEAPAGFGVATVLPFTVTVTDCKGNIEVIIISGTSPTPTPSGGIGSYPDSAELPLEAPDSSGGNAGVLASVVAGVAAGAVALGGAAWYARRRWLR